MGLLQNTVSLTAVQVELVYDLRRFEIEFMLHAGINKTIHHL